MQGRTGFWQYYKCVLRQVRSDLKAQLRKTASATFGAVVVAGLMDYYGIVPSGQTWIRAAIGSAWPLGVLLACLLAITIRAPWKVHNQTHKEKDEDFRRIAEGQLGIEREIRRSHEDSSKRVEELCQELQTERNKTAEALKSLADKGPQVSLRFSRPFPDGLHVETDQEVCDLTFKELTSSNYTLTIEPVHSLRPDRPMPLIISTSGKENGKSVDTTGFSTEIFFEDWCRGEWNGEIPIEANYWDLKGNHYFVKWILMYDSMAAAHQDHYMIPVIVVRRDPKSYRVVPQAARATEQDFQIHPPPSWSMNLVVGDAGLLDDGFKRATF